MKRIISLMLFVLMLMSVTAGLDLTAFANSDWETEPVEVVILKDGWVNNNGTWYYGVNGSPKTGWLKDKGKWYYLDPENSGAMLSNTYEKINGKTYVFAKSGAMLENGWGKLDVTVESKNYTLWWYLNANGAARTGWLLSKGKWYYFEQDNGIMVYDTVYPIFKSGDEGITDNTDWYAFDKNGAMITNKWVRITSSNASYDVLWFYSEKSGKLAKGWKQINNKWYYFEKYDCRMFSNAWVEGAKSTEDKPVWYYLKADGSMATGWCKDNEYDHWHYFGNDGVERYGWQKVSNKWYYLYPDNVGKYDEEDFIEMGSMATGWLKLDDGTYYLSASGAMLTGTQKIDGQTYTFASSGRLINQ